MDLLNSGEKKMVKNGEIAKKISWDLGQNSPKKAAGCGKSRKKKEEKSNLRRKGRGKMEFKGEFREEKSHLRIKNGGKCEKKSNLMVKNEGKWGKNPI